MSDIDREARVQELRNLITRGEYQIDARQTAARLLDEHLVDRLTSEERTLSAAAPNALIPRK